MLNRCLCVCRSEQLFYRSLRACVQIPKSLTFCCPLLSPQEAAVDRDLGNILCKLSAQHYLPIIAHHRITAEALRHMTTKDLRKVCYLSLCVSTHFLKCVCLGICHQRFMSIKMFFHQLLFCFFFFFLQLGISEVGVQKALLHWARERTLSDRKSKPIPLRTCSTILI